MEHAAPPRPEPGLPAGPLPPVFVVSGGVGTSGEQVVQTVLAQFPGSPVEVRVRRNIRTADQLEAVLAEAVATGGTVVHTLVDPVLRETVSRRAAALAVAAIDLVGPLLGRLTETTGRPPVGQPGLYRQLRREYFDRVSAIEFTMAHDDGQNPAGWPRADVVLTGVSRTGKTPLSIYLSVLGWKVANWPLVPGIPVPPGLFELPPGRVIGLTIAPDRLLGFRRLRSSQLGLPARADYVDLARIEEELREAQKVFHRGAFPILEVTDRTVEETADEIIARISRLPPLASPLPE